MTTNTPEESEIFQNIYQEVLGLDNVSGKEELKRKIFERIQSLSEKEKAEIQDRVIQIINERKLIDWNITREGKFIKTFSYIVFALATILMCLYLNLWLWVKVILIFISIAWFVKGLSILLRKGNNK